MKPALRNNAGVALLMVLWVVAALSLFVASLGQTVRSEAVLTGVARNLVQGRAYGEAAIYQALAKIKFENKIPDVQIVWVQNWQDIPIDVEITPWNGLVNINGASLEMLSLLLEKAAVLPRTQAQQHAQNMLDVRTQWRAKGMPWESVEDILQVTGIHYPVFESIRPYLVAEKDMRSTVSINAAPQLLRHWMEERGLGSGQSGTSSFIRMLAKVPFEADGYVTVERHYLVRPNAVGDDAWTLVASSQHWHKNQ